MYERKEAHRVCSDLLLPPVSISGVLCRAPYRNGAPIASIKCSEASCFAMLSFLGFLRPAVLRFRIASGSLQLASSVLSAAAVAPRVCLDPLALLDHCLPRTSAVKSKVNNVVLLSRLPDVNEDEDADFR